MKITAEEILRQTFPATWQDCSTETDEKKVAETAAQIINEIYEKGFKDEVEEKFWRKRLHFFEQEQAKSMVPKSATFNIQAVDYADGMLQQFRKRRKHEER